MPATTGCEPVWRSFIKRDAPFQGGDEFPPHMLLPGTQHALHAQGSLTAASRRSKGKAPASTAARPLLHAADARASPESAAGQIRGIELCVSTEEEYSWLTARCMAPSSTNFAI